MNAGTFGTIDRMHSTSSDAILQEFDDGPSSSGTTGSGILFTHDDSDDDAAAGNAVPSPPRIPGPGNLSACLSWPPKEND